MKVSFNTLFEEKEGELYFKQRVRIMGISFSEGINAKGCSPINFQLFKDRDLQVETDGDEVVLRGIY